MKKCASILVLFILLPSILICLPIYLNHCKSVDNDNIEESENQIFLKTSDNSILEIEKEYLNRKKTVKSNAELTNLNEEYTDIWKSKMLEYYDFILDYYHSKDDKAMIEKTKSMIENWNVYYQSQFAYYNDFLLSEYGSGSIVPINLSNYNRISYRDRALELSIIYHHTGS